MRQQNYVQPSGSHRTDHHRVGENSLEPILATLPHFCPTEVDLDAFCFCIMRESTQSTSGRGTLLPYSRFSCG